MTVFLKRKSFTVEEYHQLAEVGILKPTDRVELINGDIITMTPIKSPHAGMVNRLSRIMNNLLNGQATICPQNPITIRDNSEPEPNVVIAHYRDDDYESNHPTPENIYLLIEVSDTTLEKDREVKHPLYASAGIPEYWIINLIDRQIEIHRQPKNGEYHYKLIISEPGEIKCNSIDFSVDYTDIFKNQ